VVTELVRPRGHKSNSGGPNAPRFANGNINWNEVYRKYLSDIMTNHRALNTVRGLMYIVKATEILKKSDSNTLDKPLVNWRLDGNISWRKSN
jgi:hypothetical protein